MNFHHTASSLALLLACATAWPTAAQHSTAPTPSRADQSGALAWADCEGDGDLDLLAVRRGALGLFLNDGGHLVEVTETCGLSDITDVSFALWGDYDVDGDADLFLASVTGTSRLLRQAQGLFEDVTTEAGLAHEERDLFASWTDLDGDGALDLVVRSEESTTLYENRGDGLFEPRTLDLGGIPAPASLALSALGLDALEAAGLELSFAPRGASDRGDTPAGGSGAGPWDFDPFVLDPVLTGTGGGTQFVTGMATAAARILDQADGSSLLEASSVPTLGLLYPLSEDFFVEAGSGFVGIGTTDPDFPLHVQGSFASTVLIENSLAASNAVALRVSSDEGTGIEGIVSEDGIYGLYGRGPTGVFGLSSSGDGVVGLTSATGGNAVYGSATADGSTGVLGEALHVGSVGVKAENPNGTALEATGRTGIQSTGTSGHGVRGVTNGTSSTAAGVFASGPNNGLIAHATDTSGVATGVYGETASGSGGIGVHGKSTTTDHDTIGVLGESLGGGGTGVIGRSSLGNGVWGQGRGYGVLGRGLDDGEAVVGVGGFGLTYAIYGAQVGTYQGGAGVFGQGNVVGVSGHMSNDGGTGVKGVVDAAAGYGGLFEARTSGGIALRADNTSLAGDIIVAANGGDTEFRVNSTGNVYCDGGFTGGGADYAEWLEQLDANEELRPGDVVGLFDGRITKRTEGARRCLVISTDPVLVGNAAQAEDDEREGHAIAAFLGQVPVRVIGSVRAGDLLVPSGLEDGTARAIAPTSIGLDDLLTVIGTAWEDAEGAGVERVNAAIGLDLQSAVARVLESERRRDAARLELFESRLAALEGLVQTDAVALRAE